MLSKLNKYARWLLYLQQKQLASMQLIKKILFFIFMFALAHYAEGQKKNSSYQKYISTYNELAVKQQKEYKIPASITLAQGILESNAGQSTLAKSSNNHFGIKCHDWTGATVYHDDDKKGECFRKYKNVEESYKDHSLFLAGRSRYAELFNLNIKDYKGWAKGLQKAGYATNKAYANLLIKLIEDYELYRFDSGKTVKETKKTTKETKKADEKAKPVVKRPLYKAHGLIFVYAENDDSFEKIAEGTGVKVSNLKKFNEVPDNFPLQRGDMLYLEKKKKIADKPYYDHVVLIGESMHSISQKFGIQVDCLYKLNKKKTDYVPVEGDVLKLR